MIFVVYCIWEDMAGSKIIPRDVGIICPLESDISRIVYVVYWNVGIFVFVDYRKTQNSSGQMIPTSRGSILEPAISSQMQYIAKIVFVLFVLGRIPYESIRKTLVAF